MIKGWLFAGSVITFHIYINNLYFLREEGRIKQEIFKDDLPIF